MNTVIKSISYDYDKSITFEGVVPSYIVRRKDDGLDPLNVAAGIATAIDEYFSNKHNKSEECEVYLKTMTSDVYADVIDMIWHSDRIRVGSITPRQVIFNGPATIIIWNDGTKTVVKKQKCDKKDDREKAIVMCFIKKLLGNEGRYYNTIAKALEMAEVQDV